MTWFRLRAQQCQFCCHVISRWPAFFGVLNCGDCVRYLRSGRSPRCRVTGTEHVGHSGS